MRDSIPGPEDNVWESALNLLADGLGVYPRHSLDGVRFCGVSVGNTAVVTFDDHVCLRIDHTARPGSAPAAVWDLAMTPRYARYLAALLDSHARYIQTGPTYRKDAA
ncbi:hypothetical protein [Amycolatopsis magusensis]|uniref:hypothetical protein n=1 Tax=Amycolatopsis magusensis TaxID=882444 RepID=UPI003C2C7697